MSKQTWLAGLDPPEPVPRAHEAPPESSVFPLCPPYQERIQGPEGTTKRRWVVAPVIPHPASKHRPGPLRKIHQGEIIPTMQPPAPNALA